MVSTSTAAPRPSRLRSRRKYLEKVKNRHKPPVSELLTLSEAREDNIVCGIEVEQTLAHQQSQGTVTTVPTDCSLSWSPTYTSAASLDGNSTRKSSGATVVVFLEQPVIANTISEAEGDTSPVYGKFTPTRRQKEKEARHHPRSAAMSETLYNLLQGHEDCECDLEATVEQGFKTFGEKQQTAVERDDAAERDDGDEGREQPEEQTRSAEPEQREGEGEAERRENASRVAALLDNNGESEVINLVDPMPDARINRLFTRSFALLKKVNLDQCPRSNMDQISLHANGICTVLGSLRLAQLGVPGKFTSLNLSPKQMALITSSGPNKDKSLLEQDSKYLLLSDSSQSAGLDESSDEEDVRLNKIDRNHVVTRKSKLPGRSLLKQPRLASQQRVKVCPGKAVYPISPEIQSESSNPRRPQDHVPEQYSAQIQTSQGDTSVAKPCAPTSILPPATKQIDTTIAPQPATDQVIPGPIPPAAVKPGAPTAPPILETKRESYVDKQKRKSVKKTKKCIRLKHWRKSLPPKKDTSVSTRYDTSRLQDSRDANNTDVDIDGGLFRDKELRALMKLTADGDDTSYLFPVLSSDSTDDTSTTSSLFDFHPIRLSGSTDGLLQELDGLKAIEEDLRRELDRIDIIPSMQSISTSESEGTTDVAPMTSDSYDSSFHDCQTSHRRVRFSNKNEEYYYQSDASATAHSEDGNTLGSVRDAIQRVYLACEDLVDDMAFTCTNRFDRIRANQELGQGTAQTLFDLPTRQRKGEISPLEGRIISWGKQHAKE